VRFGQYKWTEKKTLTQSKIRLFEQLIFKISVFNHNSKL
jgi:hypothetical protein